jgi:hypothetical protein
LKKRKATKRKITCKKKGLQFIGGNPLKFCGGSSTKGKNNPFSFGKGDGDKAGNAWLKKLAKKAKY